MTTTPPKSVLRLTSPRCHVNAGEAVLGRGVAIPPPQFCPESALVTHSERQMQPTNHQSFYPHPPSYPTFRNQRINDLQRHLLSKSTQNGGKQPREIDREMEHANNDNNYDQLDAMFLSIGGGGGGGGGGSRMGFHFWLQIRYSSK